MKRFFALFLVILAFLVSMPSYSASEADDILTISMVGDILLDGSVKRFIGKNGVDYPWKEVQEYLRASDLAIGNLETSITDRNIKWEGKKYNFKAPSRVLKGLKDSGIEVVTIANNHVLDYGHDGLIDTMKNLDKYDIKYAGAGKNKKEAVKGVILEKKGVKVGILSFSRVIPDMKWYAKDNRAGIVSAYDPYVNEMLECIKEMKKEADIVILSIHWGVERSTSPRKEEIAVAKKAIDSGADIVMGHHPHVLQGIEIYKGKPIFYSLGNFVFGSWDKINSKTVIGQVVIKGKKVSDVKIIPCKIVNCRPVPLQNKEKANLIEYMRNLSNGFDIAIDKNGIVNKKHEISFQGYKICTSAGRIKFIYI